MEEDCCTGGAMHRRTKKIKINNIVYTAVDNGQRAYVTESPTPGIIISSTSYRGAAAKYVNKLSKTGRYKGKIRVKLFRIALNGKRCKSRVYEGTSILYKEPKVVTYEVVDPKTNRMVEKQFIFRRKIRIVSDNEDSWKAERLKAARERLGLVARPKVGKKRPTKNNGSNRPTTSGSKPNRYELRSRFRGPAKGIEDEDDDFELSSPEGGKGVSDEDITSADE